MTQITREEYMSKTQARDYLSCRPYADMYTTRASDKNNNIVELCTTHAKYYMYIGAATHDEFYELTLEEFNAKEHELMGDTIYRISQVEFRSIQRFQGKPYVFDILFYAENYENFSCGMRFWYNKNGIFVESYDTFQNMTGYFKISDNLKQFSTDKIVNRLKKYYPAYNIKQKIKFIYNRDCLLN